MKSNPIYIIENQVYRFEQVIDGMIELFNGKTDMSVMIEESLSIEEAIEKKLYTIIYN
jgi:hypothetical protein